MSDIGKFALPLIDDETIAVVVDRMGMRKDAFGEDGSDERYNVLRNLSDIDVCACPGSGKTTLLVAKLGALMAKWQTEVKGVCVLSHTNVARHEIGRRLGSTSAGSRLLAKPHFVGTIHGFVNEFLAVPWLAAKGVKPVSIDTDEAIRKRLALLPDFARKIILSPKIPDLSILEMVTPALAPDSFKIGWTTFGPDKATYKAVVRAIRASFRQGYFTHHEMFVWANQFLDVKPEVAQIIRRRFPILFIDEAQDTTADQLILLNRIFTEGAEPSVIQRFGDSNQAIFNHDSDGEGIPDELAFPQEARLKTLPKSHRFGMEIANLAEPLGLQEYKMEGLGPAQLTGDVLATPVHTIFWFNDEESAKRVPHAFADLLSETFSETQLKQGLFKAVGQVHRRRDEKHFPKDVSHYWEAYDASVAKISAKPASLLQHVLQGRAQSLGSGESFAAVAGVASGMLRLIDRMGFKDPGERFISRSQHRRFIGYLGEESEGCKSYVQLVKVLALQRISLTQKIWDQEIVPLIKSSVKDLCGEIAAGTDEEQFLDWSDVDNTSAVVPRSAITGNVLTLERKGVNISVQFGSIHSVKGETHTATLVLETYQNSYNMSSLAEWFLGDRSGLTKKCSATNVDRLKLHYVAMTRPSHLVCLGLHKERFLNKAGKTEAEVIEALKAKGWSMKEA